MSTRGPRLAFVGPAWFSVVMGLCGLSLAWHQAVPLMGDAAGTASVALGGLGALVFMILAVAAGWRLIRHPLAWADDLRHPVRHHFVAALPVSLILLATVSVVLRGPDTLSRTLWWLGSLGMLGVTLWVLARWWRPAALGGLAWPTVTPVLLLPIVGNVLVPLAGVPLGHADWSAAQFGVGLLFWPLVLALIATRLAVAGPWPERLRPSVFILVSPPAVIGLSGLQLGAPLAVAWGCWGAAAFTAAWAALQLRAIAGQAFGLAHWALSFPLAALAALTLRLSASGGAMAVAGPALLAVASLVVGALLLATVRGLRNGSLLAAEPVATLQPAVG
jgi:tellurite resistance protein